jgi:hypothetical protein
VYTGVDAPDVSANYRDQLRDVLGPDHEDTDENEAREVEVSLIVDHESEKLPFSDDEPLALVCLFNLHSSSLHYSFLLA